MAKVGNTGKHARATHVSENVFLVLQDLYIRHELFVLRRKEDQLSQKYPQLKSYRAKEPTQGMESKFLLEEKTFLTLHLIYVNIVTSATFRRHHANSETLKRCQKLKLQLKIT